MNFYQILFLVVLGSVPILLLLLFGRGVVGCFRSSKAKRSRLVVYSILGILVNIAVFSVVVVVWFIYAVAHTGKDTSTDLIVLASTIIPAYAIAYGQWRVCKYVEAQLPAVSKVT